jgi:phage shock protein C
MNRERPARLTRSRDRKLAGVAGGIAEYFGLDPTVVRLLWVVVGVLSAGSAVIGYLLLWLVVPEGETAGSSAGQPASADDNTSRILLAVLLVAGALIVAGAAAASLFATGWAMARTLWPLLLLALVIIVLVRLFSRQPR